MAGFSTNEIIRDRVQNITSSINNNSSTYLRSKMNGNNHSSINNTFDSSSDEEELLALVLNPHVRRMIFGAQEEPRPQIRYNRIDWNSHVAELQTNNTFHRQYRMSHRSFNQLCTILNIEVDTQQSMRSTSGNTPIEKELIVAAGLKYLAGGTTNDIGLIFGVAPATPDRMIDKFLDAVIESEHLQPHIPSNQDLLAVADGFTGISTADNVFRCCTRPILSPKRLAHS